MYINKLKYKFKTYFILFFYIGSGVKGHGDRMERNSAL